jgi:hypothetical protein
VRFFAITKPGMIGLALAVCALWSCFFTERMTTRRANNELRASLRKIRLLQGAAAGPDRPIASTLL